MAVDFVIFWLRSTINKAGESRTVHFSDNIGVLSRH